ncbi:MAG: hypothetical protein K9H61_08040 [Bacteroidia bacterium]|nr:hypothetical protein [Bacteroidia bacterium]MCF8426627.1 hypothetical protein [Bacteroidia bacterium]MCF8446931.1 hypothetical protein [Bacteroidia bacterium]
MLPKKSPKYNADAKLKNTKKSRKNKDITNLVTIKVTKFAIELSDFSRTNSMLVFPYSSIRSNKGSNDFKFCDIYNN